MSVTYNPTAHLPIVACFVESFHEARNTTIESLD